MNNIPLLDFLNTKCFSDRAEISGLTGAVYHKFSFIDLSKPLVVTFSHLGDVYVETDQNDCEYSPWGYDFCKKYDVNVLSFASYKKANWYRCEKFYRFIESIAPALKIFKSRLGYGGSMGGYAVSAFGNRLGLNSILLINPISSLNSELAPWETRFKQPRSELDWEGDYHDGASYSGSGIIIYDPIYNLDHRHAKRYSGLLNLRLPGVGHHMPVHLLT